MENYYFTEKKNLFGHKGINQEDFNQPKFKTEEKFSKFNLSDTIFPEEMNFPSNDDCDHYSMSTNERSNAKNDYSGLKPFQIKRKLNFNEEDIIRFNPLDDDLTMNEFDFIKKKSSSGMVLDREKFEEDFIMIKPIVKGELGNVYLCLKKDENKVYVIKISQEYSSKNDFLQSERLMTKIKENQNVMIKFLLPYEDFWYQYEDSNEFEDQNYKRKYKSNKKILYVQTNYCSNGNLEEYINKLKIFQFQFSENFFWDIIFEMMCGVYYLHCIGFIHLDIKPKNFLVDEHGTIKLTDFCQSRELNKKSIDCLRESMNSQTSFSSKNSNKDFTEGDSVYMAPEFFTNINQINYKTDVFSLGLSIYEILSGVSLPKNGEIWQRIRSEGLNNEMMNYIPFQNIRLRNLILKMTAINQEERWSIDMFLKNENFFELNQRFNQLKNNCYQQTFDPFFWKEFSASEDTQNYQTGDDFNISYAKRSDSSMGINFNSF
ncbi:MAG: protein kinase [archaeon]|nr:protein kinase [archaeon]